MIIPQTEDEELKRNEEFLATMELFDDAEAAIANSGFSTVEFKLEHVFTKGLYSRKIFMPSGSLLTSKIHMTEHQFLILQGAVTVWDEKNGTRLLFAPHSGVTHPGTRRLLYVHDDCIWITFHPTDKFTPEEVESDIIWSRVNPLLNKELKNENA